MGILAIEPRLWPATVLALHNRLQLDLPGLVGGWTDIDNRGNLSSTSTSTGTETELGKTKRATHTHVRVRVVSLQKTL